MLHSVQAALCSRDADHEISDTRPSPFSPSLLKKAESGLGTSYLTSVRKPSQLKQVVAARSPIAVYQLTFSVVLNSILEYIHGISYTFVLRASWAQPSPCSFVINWSRALWHYQLLPTTFPSPRLLFMTHSWCSACDTNNMGKGIICIKTHFFQVD